MEKNITIEDKAKAYDEAVKEASIAYKDEDRHLKAVLERIFPELADSKDERIRKAIIKFLIDVNNGAYRKSELEIASWIAWLEKQGQNKLIDKVEPKFKVGDKVYALRNRFECTIESMDETTYYGDTTNFDIKDQDNWKLVEQKSVDKIEPKFKVGDFIVNYYCMGKVIELTNDAYLLDSEQGIPFSCEHNAHLWTIEDAQHGDLIYVSTEEKGIQAIFHEYKDKTIFFHCYLCSDFEQGGYMPIGSVELVYPLQKAHYKRFFEKMHEAGYEWNAEKKELKEIEQSPSWSEEDEKFVHGLIRGLAAKRDIHGHTTFSSDCIDITQTINWLKSLKEKVQPQFTWRPNEHELEVLKLVAEKDGTCLMGLYKQLKKLKEE